MQFLMGLFFPNDFMPHLYCYWWSRGLVPLHRVSDSLIALAYFSIPITFLYLIRKRRDPPFTGIFVCFGAFILACWATHVMGVLTLGHPTHWLPGGVKALTALISAPTAILLAHIVPQALALPSPEALRHEIAERQRTDEALHQGKKEVEVSARERIVEVNNSNQILLGEQRERAEEELRQSEERFRLLVESVQDRAIFMLDPSGLITSWNAGAQKIEGYQAKEILGRHFSLFYPREGLVQHKPQRELDAAAANGRFEGEGWRIRKDGSPFWANVVIAAVRDQRGKLIGFSNITRDLSDRKHADDEQRKLASLVEHSSDFIVMATPEGPVLFVNPAGQSMVGLDGDEAVRGAKITDYLVEEDQDKFRGQVWPALLRDERWEGEMRLRHFKTGAAIPVHQQAFCIKEADSDRPLALATISRDITERKRAEEQLRLAQAELEHVSRVTTMGELTASIAHEINQPLTAIVNNANACEHLLACHPPDLAEVRLAIADIAQAGTRAGEVLTHIRALLQKRAPAQDRVDINEVIREVLALVPNELGKHHISVRTELLSNLAQVLGDRVQLQQVVLNLVMNGIEAMTVSTRRPGLLLIRSQMHESGNVLVAVQDTGAGLDPRNASHIFDAFFTTKAAGMGMGLPICRSIVEAHGGHLSIARNESEGVTFQFTLPACA